MSVEPSNILASGLDSVGVVDNFLDKLIGPSYTVAPEPLLKVTSNILKTVNWKLVDLDHSIISEIQETVLRSKEFPDLRSSELVDLLDGYCYDKCSPKTFHIFGERLGLDSFTLNQLVLPYTSQLMPSGLEIAATAFGSDRARDYLEISRGRTDPTYMNQLERVEDSIDEWKANQTETISSQWFDSLSELSVDQPRDENGGSHFPSFMKDGPWLDEKLTTVLGSWAQYRHDIILYTQQSMGFLGCSTPEAYVEPYPLFYSALRNTSDLFRSTFDNLKTLGFDPNEWNTRVWSDVSDDFIGTTFDVFDRFSTVLTNLEIAASHQLMGEAPPAEVSKYIKAAYRISDYDGTQWGWLADLVSLINSGAPQGSMFNALPDTRSSLVADVLIDFNNKENLAVATGYLEHLIAKVALPNGDEILAVGPVFSYYEFKTPMSIRMTDNEWRGILTSYSPDSSYNYSLVPRGFWAKNYMTSTSITQGHLFEEESFHVPEWFKNNNQTRFSHNYDINEMNLRGEIAPIQKPLRSATYELSSLEQISQQQILKPPVYPKRDNLNASPLSNLIITLFGLTGFGLILKRRYNLN